jgi:hypothetical protein
LRAVVESSARKPLGSRIRLFFEQLFTSRHVRFLENELIRVRVEKAEIIHSLQDEKKALQAKIEKLELAIWPSASRAGAAYAAQGKPRTEPVEFEAQGGGYLAAVAEHMKAEAKLEEEQAKQQKAKEN